MTQISSSLAPLADELGDLDAELQPYRSKMKRAEALRYALRGAHRNAPAADSFSVEGARWRVLLGPCGSESIVDEAALLALVGADLFVQLASVSLKAIAERCAPEIAGRVVSTRMSGARPLSIIAAAPAPAAPAAPAKKGGKRGTR